MPKATTTTEKASGYATTTREQAIAMSVRSYDKFESGGSNTAQPVPDASTGSSGIVGAWDAHIATGTPQDIHLTYVFNIEGTYNYLVRSTYDYSCNAYKGNYRIDNGRLLFTNVSKILFDYDKPGYRSLMAEAEKAGYKPTEDIEKTLEIINGSEIVIEGTYYEPVKE
jgi:hypothetical protein